MFGRKLSILATLSLAALALCACNAGSLAPGQAAEQTPVEVVESFYGWYLDNLGYDPATGEFRKPEGSEYPLRPEVSEELIARRAEIIASFEGMPGGGYDPLLCAQDIPAEIKAELAEASGEGALVAVETSFANHRFGVRLEKFERWEMVEVLCDFTR
ncbi:MAG: hypothetical protein ACLFWD_03920 [Anaerolineales bacterium]